MTLEEKQKYAKETLGLTQAYNMSEATLDSKIKECNEKLVETREPKGHKQTIDAGAIKVVVDDNGKEYLDTVEFDYEQLESRASELGFEKLEYINKHRAFKCYKQGQPVDWLDIGAF